LILSRADIQAIIPHREPFVLLDEVTEVEFGKYAVGVVKDVGDYDFFAQLRHLDHRPEDLILVDSVRIDSRNQSASGTIENVGSLKQLFEGHFPGQPTLPGALTLEALAEVAHRYVLQTEAFQGGAFLRRIDNWRFRQVVVPGNEVELSAEQRDVGVMMARATVNGKTAAEGKLTFVPGTQTPSSLPGQVTLPGALIVEAMAEVGAVAVLGMQEHLGKIAFLAGINDWQFHLPVLAGEELTLKACLSELRLSFGKGRLVASSAKGVVAEGNLVFGLGVRTARESDALVCA
jgi:3-hydroxyacyl-[acyl-carrier-protein] dehydratase